MNENLNLQKLLNHNLNPTTDNLQVIYSKLQQLAYFNSFIEKNLKGTQKESLLDLCGKFRMEHFKGGELIFKEGDKSNDKLYIIFNGKVGLVKARAQQPKPPAPPPPLQIQTSFLKPPLLPQKTSSPVSPSGTNFFRQLAYSKKFADKMKGNVVQGQTNEKVQINQQEIQVLNEKYGEVIRVLKRGDGFGERALIDNVPRGLSACAYTQDLFLLILKKEDFDGIRQQFISQMKEKKSLIFTKFPVQGDYSAKLLEQLAYSFDVEQFSKGSVLTVDGLHKKSFYLIQNGDVLLEKIINDQMIKVCILSKILLYLAKGQLLGEEVVMNEDGCFEYNSIVLSNEASLMVIHKHEFLVKFPEQCKTWVKLEYTKKKKFRQIFQAMNMESVERISKPTSQRVKQSIDIKVSHRTIRSQERISEQDIGDILDEKNAMYQFKYQSNPEHDVQSGLFGEDLYKTPKLGFVPSYERLNNVIMKSFHQQHLRRLMKQKRKLEMIKSPPLTARSTKQYTTSTSTNISKHKHTYSTGIFSHTPCLTQSPNSLINGEAG